MNLDHVRHSPEGIVRILPERTSGQYVSLRIRKLRLHDRALFRFRDQLFHRFRQEINPDLHDSKRLLIIRHHHAGNHQILRVIEKIVQYGLVVSPVQPDSELFIIAEASAGGKQFKGDAEEFLRIIDAVAADGRIHRLTCHNARDHIVQFFRILQSHGIKQIVRHPSSRQKYQNALRCILRPVPGQYLVGILIKLFPGRKHAESIVAAPQGHHAGQIVVHGDSYGAHRLVRIHLPIAIFLFQIDQRADPVAVTYRTGYVFDPAVTAVKPVFQRLQVICAGSGQHASENLLFPDSFPVFRFPGL